MSIADDNENPKGGKRALRPSDALSALRSAMEQHLSEQRAIGQRLAQAGLAHDDLPPENPPEPVQQHLETQAKTAAVPDMALPVESLDPPQPKPEPRPPEPELTASEPTAKVEAEAKTGSAQAEPQPSFADWPQILLKISERNQKLLASFLLRNQDRLLEIPSCDPAHLSEAFMLLTNRILNDPQRYADAQITLWQGYIKIWQASLARLQGKPADPVISPSPSDKRFQDAEWQNHWLFDFIKQSYLLTAKWTQGIVREEGSAIDPKLAQKLDFYTRQMVDAVSPSNFWMTNPEVLRTTLASGGENLVKGFENLLADLERGHGQLRITMSNRKAFKVGKPEPGDDPATTYLATTPGKVVFQNELIQLIQYEPTTPTVHATPMLIMPPWINKFYILDLNRKKSFIRHLVDQGQTVFCISWVNPDAQLAHIGFDDYMTLGALAGMRAVRAATGANDINMVGYCIGGTLLASTLAYLKAAPTQPAGLPNVASATYLVTMVDFEEPGDLGVFIDDEQISAIEDRMSQSGFLDAASMATTFNMLRANDLIWSFVVNNYLLGKEPFPFDILYWNGDSTNLPAAMHSFYLREMYLHNRLAQRNGLKMKNVSINLRAITTPTFMLSTSEDHIAPWRSTYAATQIYNAPITFVLSGSGHIAGVVNPPAAKKYSYWTNNNLIPSPDAWLEQAERHEGSWWPHWLTWLKSFSGAEIPARAVTNGIENAPGSYARVMAN